MTKVWVYAEVTPEGPSTSALELLTKARSIGDEEEAAILSEDGLSVVKQRSFSARYFWQEGSKTARVQFSVAMADPNRQANPVVIWRNPRLRFRTFSRRREEPPPPLSQRQRRRPEQARGPYDQPSNG